MCLPLPLAASLPRTPASLASLTQTLVAGRETDREREGEGVADHSHGNPTPCMCHNPATYAVYFPSYPFVHKQSHSLSVATSRSPAPVTAVIHTATAAVAGGTRKQHVALQLDTQKRTPSLPFSDGCPCLLCPLVLATDCFLTPSRQVDSGRSLVTMLLRLEKGSPVTPISVTGISTWAHGGGDMRGRIDASVGPVLTRGMSSCAHFRPLAVPRLFGGPLPPSHQQAGCSW